MLPLDQIIERTISNWAGFQAEVLKVDYPNLEIEVVHNMGFDKNGDPELRVHVSLITGVQMNIGPIDKDNDDLERQLGDGLEKNFGKVLEMTLQELSELSKS